LPECAKALGKDAERVFSSNLLPNPTNFDYSNASYGAFLEARVKLVMEFVGQLCDGNSH